MIISPAADLQLICVALYTKKFLGFDMLLCHWLLICYVIGFSYVILSLAFDRVVRRVFEFLPKTVIDRDFCLTFLRVVRN